MLRPTLVVTWVLAAVAALATGCGDSSPPALRSSAPSSIAPATAGPGTPAPATAGPGPGTAVAPGTAAPEPDVAFVNVTVATLWLNPGQARAVDAPILGRPVDMSRWVSSMSRADKLWLVDRLATQVLYGERVQVLDRQGDWAKVAVPRQPSSLDARGYPGWMPSVQLSRGPVADTGRWAVVTRPTAVLRAPGSGADRLELSYNTRLPVVGADAGAVTVATPDGRGVLAAADVAVQGPSPPPHPTGADLVRSAQLFSGLPYLWAGTSSSGYDCSGFTSAVYGASGIVLPRDADDQAATGTPVDPRDLQPGDLLFYATDGGKGAIHHVSMYVGNRQMIQSPSTGKTIETVPVDTPGLAVEFWGARRYL